MVALYSLTSSINISGGMHQVVESCNKLSYSEFFLWELPENRSGKCGYNASVQSFRGTARGTWVCSILCPYCKVVVLSVVNCPSTIFRQSSKARELTTHASEYGTSVRVTSVITRVNFTLKTSHYPWANTFLELVIGICRSNGAKVYPNLLEGFSREPITTSHKQHFTLVKWDFLNPLEGTSIQCTNRCSCRGRCTKASFNTTNADAESTKGIAIQILEAHASVASLLLYLTQLN